MFVNWNNSSSNPYWNYNLERNWNVHEYSSLLMFLEFQESRIRDLNSTVDSTKTTETGSAFQMGMVRGKNEYFRASEYVRYLVYCNS